MPKLRPIALFVCLLAPSAWLAWSFRDLPHLGPQHDDSLYLVAAKSLAERGEYRIESLPGEPWQTKYPPLYSAYLSLAWLVEPRYPANLPWAMLLQWLWLPVWMALIWRMIPLEGRQRWAFLAMFAIAPYVNFFGVHLMTETMAAALALAACLAARRSPWAAGLLTGAAFLTRTACLPLALVIPALYVLAPGRSRRRRWRDAALFLATSLPAIVGWTIWSGWHRVATDDPALLYYTNYFAIYWRDAQAVGLPFLVWKNVSNFLVSAGQLMVFTLADNGLTMNIARSLGLLAVVGTVRLVRREGWRQAYFLFAALYTVQLLVWNYPPDPRFLLPVAPLLMAGFVTEISAFLALMGAAWTSRKRDERIFVRLAAPVLAAAALAAVAANIDGAFFHLPAELRSQREGVARAREAYRWIREQTPAQAAFYSNFDPVLYLETGRKAMRLPMPAALAYREDRSAIRRLAFDLDGFATRRGLDYLYVSRREPQSLLRDDERDDLWRRNAERALYRRSDVVIVSKPLLVAQPR